MTDDGDRYYLVEVHRQINVTATVLIPPVTVRGVECNKLTGRYRQTDDETSFVVELWERYDEQPSQLPMNLTPAVFLGGVECNKLIGRYRETVDSAVVELWERYDVQPSQLPSIDVRRPVFPKASTDMPDRPMPRALEPIVLALVEQMRQHGVPANTPFNGTFE